MTTITASSASRRHIVPYCACQKRIKHRTASRSSWAVDASPPRWRRPSVPYVAQVAAAHLTLLSTAAAAAGAGLCAQRHAAGRGAARGAGGVEGRLPVPGAGPRPGLILVKSTLTGQNGQLAVRRLRWEGPRPGRVPATHKPASMIFKKRQVLCVGDRILTHLFRSNKFLRAKMMHQNDAKMTKMMPK